MRKTSGTLSFCFIALFLTARAETLLDVYRKGPIQFAADPNFGKDTRWAGRFILTPQDEHAGRTMGRIRQLAITDDLMLISASFPFEILRLDMDGRIVGSFGEGGTMLYSNPLLAGIADGRVGIKNRDGTLLIFEVSGRFTNSISPSFPYVDAVLLNQTRIATLAPAASSSTRPHRNPVSIVDAETRKEINVRTGFSPVVKTQSVGQLAFPNSAGGVGATKGTTEGDVVVSLNPTLGISLIFLNPPFSKSEWMIRRMADGNLLVGVSTEPALEVYSPDGRKLRTYRLQIDPLEFTEQVKEEYLEDTLEKVSQQLDSANPNATDWDHAAFAATTRELVSKPDFFPKESRYYSGIVVDSENNILVFLPANREGELPFQVYSPDGAYVCDSVLDPGVFKIWRDSRSSNLVFHGDFLYALVGDTEQFGGYRIIRVKLR